MGDTMHAVIRVDDREVERALKALDEHQLPFARAGRDEFPPELTISVTVIGDHRHADFQASVLRRIDEAMSSASIAYLLRSHTVTVGRAVRLDGDARPG